MYSTKYENIVVKLSDGSIIKGKLNIRDYNRLSDYLRHSQDQFFVIVAEESGKDSEKVFFVNKDYVVQVAPEYEQDLDPK